MASLAGATTALQVSGLAGKPYGDTTKVLASVARPNDGAFTRLASWGPAQPYGPFTGKTLSSGSPGPRSDTYRLVMTMSGVDAVTTLLSDTYSPVMQMIGGAGTGKIGADIYTPVMTMSRPLMNKTGETAVPVFDSYRLVMTMVAPSPVPELFAQTDSYRPVMSMSITVSSAALVVMGDTYRAVLTETISTRTVDGELTWPRTDTYVVNFDMSARAAAASDVDRIRVHQRPFGRIKVIEI